jgi:hypothetical protein
MKDVYARLSLASMCGRAQRRAARRAMFLWRLARQAAQSNATKRSGQMRNFVILLAAAFVTSVSFFASADNSHGLAVRAPTDRSEQASLNSRCVKKVALGPDSAEVGCLMQKRKGRSA